ncbi:MAG: cyclopropane-fatty-acyl-phospholipid synthase [Gammaproteobacteria bacterium]|nr:MAG: cyclopropane-fatty-acyl-phospholipid synthase [Gammaproteobacteria bacterium]
MDMHEGEANKDDGIFGSGEPARASLFSDTLLKNTKQGFLSRLRNRVTWIDRWLTRKMVDVVGNPPVRIYLWDNIEATPPVDKPMAILQYNNRSALLKTIANPELYWGDLYSSGQVDFEGDLAEFMAAIYNGISGKGKGNLLRRAVIWLGHRRIANSEDRARENINHHYDISNDFYQLWLDKEVMQYTCAYYSNPDFSLEQAQVAKLHHVCRKLQLKPGDTVVEAGSGWGGLALFMARHYGAKVRAYNISTEQVKYATDKATKEGLSDLVEYVLDDYRNITGEYDVFVSVGMLEHVGNRDYPGLGKIIQRCLKPNGRGLIHTIGRNTPGPMNAWVERRIFPGAYPPTIAEMMDIFQPGNLSVTDIENLRLHYSKTLEQWLQRFEQDRYQVELMLDKSFVRAWRLYLAGSIAAFNTGNLQLFQVVFSHAENSELPWSRAHLYIEDEGQEIAQESSIASG